MNSRSTAFEAPLPSVSVMSQTRLLVGMSAWVFWGLLAVVLAVLGYLYADSLRVLAQS